MSYFVREFSDDKVSAYYTPECMKHHILEYVLDKYDYFPFLRMVWNTIDTTVYTFRVGDETIDIPSGLYVMIGDETGLVDWVMVDEIIGRSMDVFVVNSNFVGWKLKELVFVSLVERQFYWPNTKNVVPITNQSNSFILLTSRADQHKSTLDKIAQDFVVD